MKGIYMNRGIIKQIYRKIKKYNTIVIARHISPDPDAIASQISLRESIKLTFPNKNVYAVGAGVSKFKYYGLLDRIDEDALENALLIVCDVPNYTRIDGVDPNKFVEIVKIDHHPSTEKFASVDWIEETSSSTCQMIIELLLNCPLKMDKKIAENLYMGVVSDSDRFLLSYTTAKTFKLVGELIEKTNIDFTSLYANLYERPISEIRFHGFIATNLNLTDNGLAYIKISAEDVKEYNVDAATASNMINDFNFIKDVYVWTFITYDDRNDIYKINIRSKGPIINEVAAIYNVGGNKFASGIRMTDKREIDNLLNDLDQACKEYKESAQ